MLKPYFWNMFFYKRLLAYYNKQLKVVCFRLNEQKSFRQQILKSFKQDLMRNFYNVKPHGLIMLLALPHLAAVIKPVLFKPSIKELFCDRGHIIKQVTSSFLLQPPKYPTDLFVSLLDNEVYFSFFYLHQILECLLYRMRNFIVWQLQHWLLGRMPFSLEFLFSFFAKQTFFLSKLKSLQFGFTSNVGSLFLNKHIKANKITKKKKKKPINHLTPEISRFLINLIKISSRAGARLRNFKHFMLFLKKLRMIGGYSRLLRVIINLNPFFYFRKRYRGRKSFFVPHVILPEARYKFIGRSLLTSTIQRKTERGFSQQLIMEVVDALRKRGRTYRYKTYALSFTNTQKFNVRKFRRRNRLLRRRVFY